MKTLVRVLNESLLMEGESIKNEKDFRAAAEAKFKKVFGADLDENQMNKTINGILKDNKKFVDSGDWGALMGILNKSFGK